MLQFLWGEFPSFWKKIMLRTTCEVGTEGKGNGKQRRIIALAVISTSNITHIETAIKWDFDTVVNDTIESNF